MKPSSTTWRAAIEFCALYLCDCSEDLTVLDRGQYLPEIPTVYAHLFEGGIEYVGMTSNLRLRHSRHELDRAKGRRRWDAVAFFRPGVPELLTRLIVETILIVVARPPGNKAVLLRLVNGVISEIRYKRKGRRKAG